MSLLLHALLWVCVVAVQDKGCSISGTLVDSITGAPLNKVTISTGGTASVRSNSEGHFTITGLERGDYQLKGNRNGYLETLGKRIALTAGQDPKDVQFRMKRFGVISGTVRDEDGEPLNRVTVNVTSLRFGTSSESARSWDSRRLILTTWGSTGLPT